MCQSSVTEWTTAAENEEWGRCCEGIRLQAEGAGGGRTGPDQG